MAIYAARAPRTKGTGTGEGAEWTEEQKEAYAQQWDNYTLLMAKRNQGDTRDFDCVIISIGEPHEVPNTFKDRKSDTRTVRTFGVQLTHPGVNMLRFFEDGADNPFNDKTLLYKAIRAVAGFTPNEEEGLDMDFDTLLNKPCRVTLQKQGKREDGKRGGFWTKVKGFNPVFDDDDIILPATTAKVTVAPALVEGPADPWDEE